MTSRAVNADRPGLLLIGHGTRSAPGVQQCLRLVEEVAALAPGLPIAAGFLEFARPGLDEATERLVAAGATDVVAVPLVLLPAGHLKNDGPAFLGRARQRHPDVTFHYARDLGTHPLVLAAAEERIRATLQKLDVGDAAAVVLVGRGSTDPDANAELYKVGRLLGDSRGLGLMEPAFVSLAPPSIPDALERCRLLGAARVAVVPYFLFTGLLVERIGARAREWARAHPEVGVAVGDEMGPDRRLARLALERYQEARSGGAAMNCDCCIYRVALPGYEHRVGTPVGADGQG